MIEKNIFFLFWVCLVSARAHKKNGTFWLFLVLGTYVKNTYFLNILFNILYKIDNNTESICHL